jgi:hypothetical protein
VQKYWNTVLDEQGRPREGASVAVQQSGVNSTIYANQAGTTTKTNPLTTNSRGYFEFYAAAGEYDLVVSGNNFETYTILDGALIGDIWFNVKWYGAVGNGTTDDTAAVAAAVVAAAAAGGGVVYLPEGRYKLTDEITITSGITIRGQSNVDEFYGTKTDLEDPTFIFQATASKACFKIGSDVCDVVFSDLCLASEVTPLSSNSPSANKIGLKFAGAAPQSSYRFTIQRVNFYNFDKGISVDVTSGSDWQCDAVIVEECHFLNNTKGVYFNTMNADAWNFVSCTFTIPTNGDGIYAERVGYLALRSCYATDNGSTTGTDLIHLGDFHDNILLDQVAGSDGLTNFVHVDTSTGFENVYNTITLVGCIVECASLYERQCVVTSLASRYTENQTCSGADIQVNSWGDTWSPTTKKYTMSGTRPNLYVSPGSTQTKGTVATTSTVAATAFAIPDIPAMYHVFAYIADTGAIYQASAVVRYDGTEASITASNGAGMTLTLSSLNVQVTQNSGAGQTVSWSYYRLA